MTLPWRLLLIASSLAGAATPVFGQSRADDDAAVPEEQQRQQQEQEQEQEQKQQETIAKSGRVAESAFGRAGQRQKRGDMAPNLYPMERISNRIDNRIELRIRNRIDPDYDPQADARSSLATAKKKQRTTGR